MAAILLLVTSKASFIESFNREMLDLYGAKDAYRPRVESAGEGMPSSMFAGNV